MRIVLTLLVAAMVVGCVPRRDPSPEDIAAYQRKQLPRLATIYPTATPRADILASYPPLGGEKTSKKGIYFIETFEVPLIEPVKSQLGTTVESSLPRMIAAAALLCETKPERVDIFMMGVGVLGLSTAGHYVFYDKEDRVLLVLEDYWH